MANRRTFTTRFTPVLALIVLIPLLLSACTIDTVPLALETPTTLPSSPSAPTTQPTANPPPGTVGLPAWLAVYFTNPNPPDAIGHGIDQYVQPAIDQATQTIDVTSFDLNLPSLVNALVAASQRGVKVRVVYDGTNGTQDLENNLTNNQPFNAVKTLKAAGIELIDGGRSNGLMHDKMIIVDGRTLFMGSWNLSYNDTYRNNNNLLEITNPLLIANYQAKFNELFVDKNYGTHAVLKAPNPSLSIDGVQVENYFAPEDHVMDKLIQYVQGAQKSVHFMIFTFTEKSLASAMIARAKAGVDVQGVIENRGATEGALGVLVCAKLPVKVDGNKYTMHHKVIIIDGETVITGSFNFTNTADTANDDNLLVLHSPAVAALYEEEYQRIHTIGQDPKPADIQCK